MTLPCNCCPAGEEQCATAEHLFDGGDPVLVSQGTATGVYPLSRWSDGDVAGPNFTGFNSPGVQFTAATSPVVDLNFATPQNRVRGIREWNQGGSDLGDGDGFASWDMEFFAGAASLGTYNMAMGNGGAPFTFLLPGGQELNGVTRVRLSNMRKLNPGSGVSPLVREVRAMIVQTVYPCRRPNGTIEWYNENGLLVPSADVVTCDGLTTDGPIVVPPAAPQPFTIPDLHLLGGAFADASGENLCNLTPAPSANSGWAAPSGGCYDPVSGTPTMDWAPTTSLDFTYGGPGLSGGVFMHFSSPSLGAITWPVNNAQMTIGEQRYSNLFGGGHIARMTYISGAGGSMQMPGGTQLNVHFGSGVVATNNRFLLEFFTP